MRSLYPFYLLCSATFVFSCQVHRARWDGIAGVAGGTALRVRPHASVNGCARAFRVSWCAPPATFSLHMCLTTSNECWHCTCQHARGSGVSLRRRCAAAQDIRAPPMRGGDPACARLVLTSHEEVCACVSGGVGRAGARAPQNPAPKRASRAPPSRAAHAPSPPPPPPPPPPPSRCLPRGDGAPGGTTLSACVVHGLLSYFLTFDLCSSFARTRTVAPLARNHRSRRVHPNMVRVDTK